MPILRVVQSYLAPMLLSGGALLAAVLLFGALFADLSLISAILTGLCGFLVIGVTWGMAYLIQLAEDTRADLLRLAGAVAG